MKKIIILAVVLAVVVGGFFWARSQGYLDAIDPGRIYEARDQLLEQVSQRLLLSAIAFVLLYFVTVALSIPGATLLTLSGGFLFGPILGTLLVNIGASTGALAIFLAARYFLGSQVQEKYGEKLSRFNREIEQNGSSYLLTLRFIPIFPFFLVNLLPGFTTVKVSTFLWTTVVGIIPGSFVYTYLGFAGTTLQEGESPLTIEIQLALIFLGIISLVPVLYRKIRAKKDKAEQ